MAVALPNGFSHPMSIGGGAFGTVYRARQKSVNRWVALKIISRKDSNSRRDLLKEAMVQAQISIECIPQVYDAFEWKNNVCIVMQWIKGVTLSQLLKSSISPEMRLWLADSFIRALARLHSSGYAHRDLKPANIIISPTDGLYLVDFSFTKSANDAEKSMSGVVKGTPAYMAPEIWRNMGPVDHIRADLYSAGVILREIIDKQHIRIIESHLLPIMPSSRPSSCAEFLPMWQEEVKDIRFNNNWMTILNGITAEIHAHNLLSAVRRLITAGKHDEAYGLLVECLEENPDLGEAVELMNAFSSIIKRHAVKRNLVIVSTIVVVVLCSAWAFLAGRYSATKKTDISLNEKNVSRRHEIAFMKKSRPPVAPIGSVGAFRTDSIMSNVLAGRIIFKSFPEKGKLFIDGKPYISENGLRHGITIPFGKHILVWQSDDAKIIWRERISILPFEEKRLTVIER